MCHEVVFPPSRFNKSDFIFVVVKRDTHSVGFSPGALGDQSLLLEDHTGCHAGPTNHCDHYASTQPMSPFH